MEWNEEYRTVRGRQEERTGLYTIHIEGEIDWLCLRLDFEYRWTTLLLWDSHGKLRAQFLDCHHTRAVALHRDTKYCSYSTVPGALPAGEWRLEIQGVTMDFSIDWLTGCGDLPESMTECMQGDPFWTGDNTVLDSIGFSLTTYAWNERRETGKRWYKGDFHTHTTLSDGKMKPVEGMRQAEKMGLDFFAATDHNIVPTAWPRGTPLVIPGVEITSDKGHFNALGLRQWIDWRLSAPDGGMDSENGMNRLLADAKQAGALRSLNHPMLEPWAWLFRETPLSEWDSIEIINDPTYPTNPLATEKALKVWSALWNDGYRITGIGGSDVHALPTESYEENGPPSLIGDPATYVYAEGLSCAEILQGVERGHVYVTRGPLLEAEIAVGSNVSTIGDDLLRCFNAEISDHEVDITVQYRLTITNQQTGTVHWIENGEEALVQAIQGEGTYECEFSWKRGQYAWRRVEIRADSGELLAFTNPVYIGCKIPEMTTWGELVDRLNF